MDFIRNIRQPNEPSTMASASCHPNGPSHRARSTDLPLPRVTSSKQILLTFPLHISDCLQWLIDHGYPDEGLKTLARLHSNGNESDPWVRAEFDQIQDSITHEHENEAKSYMELLTNRSSFRRLLIACALQASIQMTGVSAIQYYSVDIYGSIGIKGSDALKYQAINNIIALVGEACCVLFVDKLGRRRPLIGGNLMNMVSSLTRPQFYLNKHVINMDSRSASSLLVS